MPTQELGFGGTRRMKAAKVRSSRPILRLVVASLAALAAACGGGGSGDAPLSTFSFASSSGSVTEGGAPLAIQVVLHTSHAALPDAVSIDVVDLGGGSGTAGTDYTVFAPQTLTFPAGSVDGDMRSVSLVALADHAVEGAPDTVRLGLVNSVGGAVGATPLFTANLGDIDVATIQFAASTSTTPDESSAGRSVMLTLDLPAGVTLDVAAVLQVVDSGTGSATSGVDYGAFAPQTITFPAGSLDGATQTVAVLVNDDTAVELDETVRLNLSSPAAGTSAGATSLHQLTITDDDALGPAAFVASEGTTGVENSLSYDELIDLGSQTLGAGPNAGTHVRVTNAGGSAMALGAPRLTGTNADDFVVEVELAPLPAQGGDEAPLGPAPDIAAPLTVISANSTAPVTDPSITFRLDPVGLTELRALTRARMHGFPVPGFGDTTLELRRVPLPIAAGAVLRVDGADVPGGLAAALGDLSVWSGSIVEIPGARVFLALASQGSRGFLELPFPGNRLVHLVTENGPTSAGEPALSHLVRDADVAGMRLTQLVDFCSEPRVVPGSITELALAPPALHDTETLTTADCRIAIETDYQLYQKFGSVGGVTSYVGQMMAAISDQYFTDLQTTLSIAYLGVYSTPADPWLTQDSGGSTSAMLDEFRNAWVTNGWPASANLAHFVSGASLGGGIAYVNVLCNQSFGFGVSGNISGTVNWGTWTGQPGNFTWDFVVVAHELGHNFGANHTHSYCPPLDQCYSNCSGTTQCSQGTLMSYCHLCGGMDNIDLEFGPMVANIMRGSVNSSCLGLSALAGGDFVQYLVRFAPWGSTGTRNATLQFTHDAPNATQPFRVQLRGTATP